MQHTTKHKFLTGLMGQLELGDELLARPGTSVVGRDDRADSNIAAVYWAGAHTFVWADPAVVERINSLGSTTTTATRDKVALQMSAAGFAETATATMRVLAEGAAGKLDPVALAPGYRHGTLSAADSSHVDLVRSFADRSDPHDVEEAALNELDDFDELAINVVTPHDGLPGTTDNIGAYASALAWDWDPAFADIGVLVDADHRQHGLGRFVVTQTCEQLLEQGHLPLYRHGGDNTASSALSTGLGFEPATELAVYRLDPSSI